MAFTDTVFPSLPSRRNPNHHRAVLAVTTAFWDAFLRNDSTAAAWLDAGVRSVLEPADRWRHK